MSDTFTELMPLLRAVSPSTAGLSEPLEAAALVDKAAYMELRVNPTMLIYRSTFVKHLQTVRLWLLAELCCTLASRTAAHLARSRFLSSLRVENKYKCWKAREGYEDRTLSLWCLARDFTGMSKHEALHLSSFSQS